MENTASSKAPKKKLLLMVVIRFASALIVLGIVIFIPAGTLKYWNAWFYLAAISLAMLSTLIYLYVNDPLLLEKRMRIKEKEKEQKAYVKLSVILFFMSFIIPGLDYRYQWSQMPFWVMILALIIFFCGYIMFIVVMKQNSYASRVIEIQDQQKLIDTGLYSVVRHPMYLAATIIYVASPVVLGSFYALIPIAFLPVLFAYRIKNEEKILLAGLERYGEYSKRVKYKLIPFVW
jgi:protein-S-isoprenylcysteine O-methyltransferase Ste14